MMTEYDNTTPAKKLIRDVQKMDYVVDNDIQRSFKSILHHIDISRRLYLKQQTAGSWIKK